MSRSPKKARYDPIYGRVHVSILRVKEEDVKEEDAKEEDAKEEEVKVDSELREHHKKKKKKKKRSINM